MADKEREPLLSGPKMEDSGSESNQHEGRTGSREVKQKESPRSSLHMAAIQKDYNVALAGVFKKKKKIESMGIGRAFCPNERLCRWLRGPGIVDRDCRHSWKYRMNATVHMDGIRGNGKTGYFVGKHR